MDALEALRNWRANPVGIWNKSATTSTRSTNPDDAANRIFDGFADIRAGYKGPRFPLDAPVFTMGSCFAREIERALVERGGNVVSVDDRIERDEFRDAAGHVRTGFFHRFTPASMELELRWPFAAQPGWSDEALIFDGPASAGAEQHSVDLNYMAACADRSPAAVRTRRRIAGDLVRRVAGARIVIVTLGLTEGWVHLPTALPVNAVDWRLLKRDPAAFELRRIDVAGTLAALAGMLATIARVHADGDFQMFVTVSPVPFISTFTDQDVVVANATSKSTLRAAATEFAGRHDRVHYFPSYEMVTYSDPGLAWRPDRIHVERAMVRHIMDRFIGAVFATG